MKIDSQKYIIVLLRDRMWFLKQTIERDKLTNEKILLGEASLPLRETIAREREMEQAEQALKELGEICSKFGGLK